MLVLGERSVGGVAKLVIPARVWIAPSIGLGVGKFRHTREAGTACMYAGPLIGSFNSVREGSSFHCQTELLLGVDAALAVSRWARI